MPVLVDSVCDRVFHPCLVLMQYDTLHEAANPGLCGRPNTLADDLLPIITCPTRVGPFIEPGAVGHAHIVPAIGQRGKLCVNQCCARVVLFLLDHTIKHTTSSSSVYFHTVTV